MVLPGFRYQSPLTPLWAVRFSEQELPQAKPDHPTPLLDAALAAG